jgi:hypothetical protein
MEKEKLYRLMDVLDEIKQIDQLISKHLEQSNGKSSLMIDQYHARKDQLLTYFINEVNVSAENRNIRLSIIKTTMERFYSKTISSNSNSSVDKNLNSLSDAIFA